MAILELHELINLYRDEIIRRCGSASAPPATDNRAEPGVAALLDQLVVELRNDPSRTERGALLPVSQPSFNAIGRAVVDLALELNLPISGADCLRLDRCLDAAIAHTVTQHVSRQNIASGSAVNELRDLTDTAIAAFEVLQTGTVGVIGTTGTLVLSSLRDIRALTEQPA